MMASIAASTRRNAGAIRVRPFFLVLSLWLLVLCADADPIQARNHDDNQETVLDCLIVGSGWAGLGAGIDLRTLGIRNFEILDARDYVGGRSRTVYEFVDNVATELGSAFLYSHDNSVLLLADTQNVKYAEILYDNDDAYGLYNETGEVKGSDKKELMDEWEEFAEFARDQATMLDYTAMDKPFQATMGLYVRNMNVNSTIENFLNTRIQAKVAVEFAANVDEISTVHVGSIIQEKCLFCHGADYYLSVEGGGFDKTLDIVATTLEPNIHLNTRVTEIQYTDKYQPIQVTYVDENGVSGIKLARTVLVTASLGVLKADGIRFTPPLPQSKQDAIDFLSFGTLNKCIFYWESPQDTWWPNGKTWMTYMPKDESKTGKWTSFFNDKDIGNGGHYILSSWSGGKVAEAAENETDEETVAIVLSNLRAMFGPQVPPPTKYIITRWGQDEFTRGSYSFESPYDINNEDQSTQARSELRRPIDDKLFFAGEATSPDFGTTYGAFDSGMLAGYAIGEILIPHEAIA